MTTLKAKIGANADNDINEGMPMCGNLAATLDERRRFRAALKAGKIATFTTHAGTWRVVGVEGDGAYQVVPVATPEAAPERYQEYNDERWADLLRAVNVPRNPLFLEYAFHDTERY